MHLTGAPPTTFVTGSTTASVGVCPGDSGSPGFINRDGEWFVAGVVSHGEPFCPSRYSAYTATDDFFDWLVANAPGQNPSYLSASLIAAIL